MWCVQDELTEDAVSGGAAQVQERYQAWQRRVDALIAQTPQVWPPLPSYTQAPPAWPPTAISMWVPCWCRAHGRQNTTIMHVLCVHWYPPPVKVVHTPCYCVAQTQ